MYSFLAFEVVLDDTLGLTETLPESSTSTRLQPPLYLVFPLCRYYTRPTHSPSFSLSLTLIGLIWCQHKGPPPTGHTEAHGSWMQAHKSERGDALRLGQLCEFHVLAQQWVRVVLSPSQEAVIMSMTPPAAGPCLPWLWQWVTGGAKS